MGIAQGLYEGIDIGKEGTVGLITYMRTDSTRVGKEAQDEAREFIASEIRQRLSSGKTAGVRQRQKRPGGARGHPAHVGDARTGCHQAISGA